MTYKDDSLQFVYIKIPSPTAAAEYTVLLLVIELEREPRVMTQFKDAHLAITRVRMEKEKQNLLRMHDEYLFLYEREQVETRSATSLCLSAVLLSYSHQQRMLLLLNSLLSFT